MRSRIKKLLLLSIVSLPLVAFGFYSILMRDFPRSASMLIHNGTVITMEGDDAAVEAVFVKEGLIVGLGTFDEMSKLKETDTDVIDLQGRTLLPGFIDSHTHPLASTFMHGMVDLSGFKHQTDAEVWQYFEAQVKEFEPGQWIVCKGMDPVLVEDLKTPHIDYLDSVAPNNPVFIVSQSLHSYWANTLAFEAAGVNASTPDPTEFSFYEKDDDGKLTGYLAEQEAFQPFRDVILSVTGPKTLAQHSVQVLDDYAKNGNTTITSLGMSTTDPNVIRLYSHLSSDKPTFANQLISFLGMMPARKPMVRHFAFIRHDSLNLLPESPDNGDDFFKILGVKFWYDGAPYAGTMYLKEPYLDTQFNHDKLHISCNHTGAALISHTDVRNYINACQNDGWQIAVHAQGDSAVQEIVDAFAETQTSDDHRHRLEHCLLVQESTLKQMHELNIHPSFHINHLYYYGKTLRDEIIGSERTDNMLPVQWAKQNDLVYSLHSDQPMFPSEPFSLMHTAVNRKTKEEEKIGPDQAIDIQQALKAVTINAAWQIKMEDKIGSIKVGKYADFVVVDQNPLETPKEELRNIAVSQTIVNGQTVYKARD